MRLWGNFRPSPHLGYISCELTGDTSTCASDVVWPTHLYSRLQTMLCRMARASDSSGADEYRICSKILSTNKHILSWITKQPWFHHSSSIMFSWAWPSWHLLRDARWPSSTCEFAVGLHVVYSRRDCECPARRALDLDVRISLYKGLGYPDTKTANDRTLKSTRKPGKWKMCC